MRRMVLLLWMFSLLFHRVCAQAPASGLSSAAQGNATVLEPATAVLAAAAPTHPSSETQSVHSGDKEPQGAKSTKANSRIQEHSTTHRPHSSPASSPTHHIPRPTSFPAPETPPHMAPPPPRPNPPGGDASKHHAKSQKYSPVAIAFETLGGIVSVFLLYALGRCLWSWRRTPERDRIETVLNRHYIQREMEERRRADIQRRLTTLRSGSPVGPPPPPYLPAPAYDPPADV